MPVKFSEEFKRDAVALVLTQGMSQKQVGADMGCGLGRYVAGFCRRFVSSLMIGRIVPWVDPQLTQPRSHA
jgi:trans-aconitate methyltransferase